jgi:hypothetical protein
MIPGYLDRQRLGINSTINNLIDKYLPKSISSGFTDDVDLLRLKLLDLKRVSDDKSISKFQKEFHQLINGKMKEWQEGIDENQKDIDRHSA